MKKFFLSTFSWKIIASLIAICFFYGEKINAQVINESFEEAEWNAITTATGGNATASTVTISSYSGAVGTASTFGTGSWYYSSGYRVTNIAASATTYTVRTGANAFHISNSGSAYLITPVIAGGITSITMWVRTASSTGAFNIFQNTNTNFLTATGSRSSTATNATGWNNQSGYTIHSTLGYTSVSYALTGAATSGTAFIKIQRTSSEVTIDDISITTAPINPTISATVSSLPAFTQAGATPTAGQSYFISGSALTAGVDVTAPAGFEVSKDSSSWQPTLNYPQTAGNISGQPAKVYVRMNDPVAGPHAGNVTHMSAGATTVNVAVSGNTVTIPTITVNPTSLAFGGVIVGGFSQKTYTVSGVLLNPAAGSITITPTLINYGLSLTAGGTPAPFLTLPYTGNTLAPTTIYVTFIPSTIATYNGDIVHTGGGAVPVSLPVTGAGVLQQVGDYGSVATGNWSTAATWKIWDGTGFNATAATAPTAATNVFINAGHSVTVENAGTKSCANLTVNGTLISANVVNSPAYITISGLLLTVNSGGQMGSLATGDAADGLSLQILNANFGITGPGGTINLSRLRTNADNSQVVINHDMTLNYHGGTQQGGHTIALYPNAGENHTYTINAGKTVTFAPWACLATTASSNGTGPSMTINVNGTLNMLDSPVPNDTIIKTPGSMIYMGTAVGKLFTLNVGATGIVNVPQIYPNGTQASGATGTGPDAVITVAAGGQLNVSKIADFRKPTQTVTGAGTFSMSPGSRLRVGSPAGVSTSGATGPIQTTTRNYGAGMAWAYEGSAAQVPGNAVPATVSNLTINNPAGLTLPMDYTVTDSLTLTAGAITTGTNKIIIPASSKVQRTGGHVNGLLQKNVAVGTPVSRTFEVGDATNYTPIVVDFATVLGAGDLTASSKAGDHPALSSSTIDPNRSVSRYYTLTNSGILFTTYDATFNFVAGDIDALADPLTFIVSKYNGVVWLADTSAATLVRTPTSTQTKNNLSFSDFAVGNKMAPAPLSDLISFNAKKVLSNGIVTWTVAPNSQIQSYEVMKGNDGRNFNTVSTISHINGLNDYQYTDALSGGTNYYRLKVTDRNGVYYYSKIVAVVNKTSGVVLISMNPTLVEGSTATLLFAAAKSSTATIIVTDMSGKKIMEQRQVIPEGNSSIGLDLPVMSAGVYNLSVVTPEGKIASLKFVKH